MPLFFYDFSRIRFSEVSGNVLPRRQRLRFEGVSATDTGEEIVMSMAMSGLQVVDLASNPGTNDGEVRATNGYTAADDGGGGLFSWAMGVSTGEDGRIKINATNGSGQWQRLVIGNVDAKWFGATGNGTTDDTAALRAAIAYAQSNRVKLRVSAGTYSVTNGGSGTIALPITDDIDIEGDGVGATTFDGGANADLIIFDVDTTGNRHLGLRQFSTIGGGVPLKVHGTGFLLRTSYIEDIECTQYRRDGWLLETAPAIGCSFFNLHFVAGTPASGVKTYGLRASGEAILHHTSFYNCRFAGYSGAPVKITYTGAVAGAGSQGTTFHKCVFEGAANNEFARTATLNSSTSLTNVSSVSLLEKGMMVTGTNIPAGAYITGISGSTVTISKAATGSGAGSSVSFWGGFGFQLFSASVVAYGQYFENNGAPCLLLDTDYDGSAVTRAKVELYGPVFDNAGTEYAPSTYSQYDAAADGFLRVLVLNQGYELTMQDRSGLQQSSKDVLVDLNNKHITGGPVFDRCPGVRVINDIGVVCKKNRSGVVSAGWMASEGTSVDSGYSTLSSFWGGVTMILAAGRTGSGPYANRWAIYALSHDSFDGTSTPSVTYVAGSSDFMTFAFTGDTLRFNATDGGNSSITLIGGRS